MLGSKDLQKTLLPEYSASKFLWKNIFLLLAVVCLIIALANPQVGAKIEKVKVKGAEIIIALDVSNSMKAEDIAPNRLDKAKQEILQLLKKMKNDRVGLIIFAGKAFIPIPLTTDYAMIRMYLHSLDTDVISTQGTDISGAIELAMESFSKEEKKDKALIIITDGEDHEDHAVKMAKKAAKMGITVHTIGLGKKEGVPIPVFTRYGKKDFRKDREGNVIVSKLNERLLNEIAKAGKGQYVLANSNDIGLNKIYKQLKGMEKTELKEKTVIDYEDDFQFYLWLALAFLLIEFALLPKKNPFLSRIRIGNAKI